MENMLLRKVWVCAIFFLFISISVIPKVGSSLLMEKLVSDDNVILDMYLSSGDKTLYVGGDGLDNYSSIQDAIDNVSDGDTIFVYDNSSPYYENVIINISINLIGENKDTTIIDGGGSGDVVSIYSDHVNISGFMITHAKHDLIHAGIKILSDQNNLSDNQISYNEAAGIIMSNSSYNKIQNNIMKNNAYYNIYLDDSSDYNTFIQNSFITESWSYSSDGLWLIHSSHNIIQGNSMPNLRCFIGIGLNQDSDNNQVGENIISSDGTGSIGLQISDSDFNNVFDNEITRYEDQGISLVFSTGNSIHGNTISLVDGGGISLCAGAYNVIQQNMLFSNEIGIRLSVNSYHNQISSCNIKDNDCGILMEDYSPHDNIIYHNNFVRNDENAYDLYSSNTWYNSDLKQGNYWDDYKVKYPNAKRIWLKGIWDTPYEIPVGDDKDMYPLISQWVESSSITTLRDKSTDNVLFRLINRFPLFQKLVLSVYRC